jgi:hypothetical protein
MKSLKSPLSASLAAALVSLVFLGLQQVSAYYDPGVQRWVNRDPLGDTPSLNYRSMPGAFGRVSGIPELLLHGSLYAYVRNQPLVLVDPLGLVCGSAGNDWIIPDYPIFDFTAPCTSHDACYSRCGSGKANCDRQFLRDLREQCRRQANSPLLCYAIAMIYYQVVNLAGQDAYDNAQFLSCPCIMAPASGGPVITNPHTTVIWY